MDREKLNEILDKHVQKFFAKAPTARFDDVPNETFIDAMEEAINYTHSCTAESEQLCKHTDEYNNPVSKYVAEIDRWYCPLCDTLA